MAITDRNLHTGDILTARYQKLTYEAVIRRFEGENNLDVEITTAPQRELKGQTYKSLSKAAMAITGNSVNGWRFWTLSGEAERRAMADSLPSGAGALADAADALEAVEGAADAVEAMIEEPAPRKPRGPETPGSVVERARARGEARAARAAAPKRRRQGKNAYFKALEDGRIMCAGCLDAYAPDQFERDETGDKIVACPKGHHEPADSLGETPSDA